MDKASVHVEHPFDPVWNSESKILILGSFPSVKSREQMFFYGHPRNRFWTVISTLLGIETPVTTEEKRAMLLNNRIALWDVIASCDIYGSADSSIKNAVPNDIGFIIENSKVRTFSLTVQPPISSIKSTFCPQRESKQCDCRPPALPMLQKALKNLRKNGQLRLTAYSSV